MCKTETKTPPKPSTTPSGSQPSSGAQTSCHPACTISSQTIATSPANRARTKIGVGEEVRLTVKGNPATWKITSGTGTLSPNTGARKTVTFTADDKAGSTTITATGSGCACVNTITFTVVRPASWTMKRQANTNLKHTNGRPDCGWSGIMYVHPNDVNFYRVETREKDSQAVCTGSYTPFAGVWHGNYGPPDQASSWFLLTAHTETDGSTDNAPDNIYSGDPGAGATNAAPPFKVGTMYFPITIQWHVVGNATIHDFPIIRQEHEIFSDGKCESRKGGLTEKSMHTDPTTTP
jgi:hypothetical protein